MTKENRCSSRNAHWRRSSSRTSSARRSADREARAALEINPRAVEPLRVRGTIALFSGKFAEAIRLLEDVQRSSKGATSDWYLAQGYYYTGERTRAEALLAELRGTGSAERRAQATLASFLAARGERSRAEELLEMVLAGAYMDHHIAYSIGAAYAQIGNREEARSWLARAAETGLPCYPWYSLDPLLRPLRRDQEFQRFLASLRRSWKAWESKYEP